jgi:hypothetical protein
LGVFLDTVYLVHAWFVCLLLSSATYTPNLTESTDIIKPSGARIYQKNTFTLNVQQGNTVPEK